ncbi:MAG: hypoxanthine phosphoribosyltransferase [Deferrisomatales bacterium]
MKLLYSEADIRNATAAVARAIDEAYGDGPVHLIGVLKGSFLFLADLVRHLRVPCTVDFVRLSSYGGGTASSGAVRQLMPLCDPIGGRHVIVVEEIVDSGHTLAKLLRDLEAAGPASLRVCALVDKTGRREVEIPVQFRGLVVDDGFLVGYGLDFNERLRNLPAIYVMEEADLTPQP